VFFAHTRAKTYRTTSIVLAVERQRDAFLSLIFSNTKSVPEGPVFLNEMQSQTTVYELLSCLALSKVSIKHGELEKVEELAVKTYFSFLPRHSPGKIYK
jgi:hypothetical protein